MSGPEGLPPQTNAEIQREPRNDIPVTNESIALQRNPLDPKSLQNVPTAVPGSTSEDKLKTDGNVSNDTLGADKKTLENTKPEFGMENINGKPKLPINANDDDDDVVVDSDPNKTSHIPARPGDDQLLSLAKEIERPDSSSAQRISTSPNPKTDDPITSRTPEVTASPTPSEHRPESAKNLERKPSAESNLRGEPGPNNDLNHRNDTKTPTPEPAKSPAPRAAEFETAKGANESPSKEKESESPIPRSQTSLSSPLPPKSLETTPGNSPKPRGERGPIPSPLLNQELEERLSISGSPEPSPKSLNPSVIGFDEGNVRSVSPKSPVPSSSPSPNPPRSPGLGSQSPNTQNATDSSGNRSPVSTKSPAPLPKSPNPLPPKSPTSTPQSPNPPKSPGCLRSSEGEKSGRSTPDTEGAKKRATFAKDLIMTSATKDEDENSPSDSKDAELTTPEESSKGTPTTPSKGTPSTPKKSFSPSSDRSRHRSRSPKSDKGKSPEKESPAARNRTARESKDRSKASVNRSRKTGFYIM